MLYVLKRTTPLKNGHPAYVARAGSDKSYTSSLRQARVFQSEIAAEQDRCGNEVIVPIGIGGQLEFDL